MVILTRSASFLTSFLLVASLAGLDAQPLACQPNAKQPMLPTFHIIGNVTQNPDGSIKLEAINDCSGLTYYQGIYHAWHQCCQNHWDHVISKDLVHWQRLPPPIQPLTTKTWDGSISMIPAEDGGPVILYDAQDGKLGEFSNVSAPLDKPILGVARLTDPHDQYLMTWTRVAGNPVKFEGAPNAFPGQIWKNGDHWNMMMQGDRYQSDDASFHSWSNKGPMVGKGEHGGQWWIRVPNQQDGSPPPAGVPNYIVNVGGGDSYMFGEYYPENETFVPWVKPGEKTPVMAQLEGAHGGWWGAQTANERMLMIGWALGDYHGPAGPGIDFLTRLTLLREVHFDAKTMNLVSNPVPELAAARTGTLAQEKGLQLAPGSVHMVGNTSAGAAASADVTVTFKLSSASGTVGVCVLSNGTSGGLGISVTAAQGNLKVTAGACADALVNRHTADSDAANNTIPLFDETEVSVRVLPDRSLADFFVQGGRWSGTVAWLEKSPRLAVDSGVQVWSSTAGVTADVEVFSMGCGWANPSYTDNPTM